MKEAKVYKKRLTIPTYGVGKEDKNPMFFEKRVYQGSSGKVYPNPVIEKIYDEKKDVEYDAVILENEWLYVIVLPELGGRIYTAYDKTNNYDFVYHNKVIKPALVGLLGPWISGGIEFNWPQHHRPDTYMPVNYKIKKYDDGSASVFVGETEKMFSLEQTTEIKLYPDKSYIEINTDIYNRSPLTQTFLWWANPAYKVNDDTRTIMPPDVTAVMDHGKRAVSTFPISTGEYYKVDYSKGVDISRYKNLPVPTSFMAYKSNFDFVGGYDYGKKAGLLHIADHHISPGKKQWTWGSGDFGIAWDRNLTDEDGPYVELMTGCFTDNQPDFTFIQPQENKSFTQYFMPYKEVGEIKNADKNFCFGYEDGALTVYSSCFAKAHISVDTDGVLKEYDVDFTPSASVRLCKVNDNSVVTLSYDGKKLRYGKDMVEKFEIPSPATACPEPKDCKSLEELYIYGLHIEQYRHATRLAEDYYLEGLRRDKDDYRLNKAYGILMLRRGRFDIALKHLETAIERSVSKNPNPYYSEACYYAGITCFLTGETDKAYDYLYKCLWSNDCKTQACYYLAAIAYLRGDYELAEDFAKKSLDTNADNIKSYDLLGQIYLKTGREKEAFDIFNRALARDSLDTVSAYRSAKGEGAEKLQGISSHEAKLSACDFIFIGEYDEAYKLLELWETANKKTDPLISLYKAYCLKKENKACGKEIARAVKSSESGSIDFVSDLTDIVILEDLAKSDDNYLIDYHLGNLYYDKKQYELAREYWERSQKQNDKFPTVKRNLALYYFNKAKDEKRALKLMEEAYALDTSDSRILMELYSLYGVTEKPEQTSFELLDKNIREMTFRDDLYIEYIRHISYRDVRKAYDMITARRFHPWEGGEGKVTKLYKEIVKTIASEYAEKGDYRQAEEWYKKALNFPHNLGEGKLILDYDNDVWYELGELAERNGDPKAKEYYTMAARGNAVVADDMYYNDNPIEYIYYKALAEQKLGNVDVAKQIKNAFINYCEVNKDKHCIIDYFAVSLPDLLVWEQDLDKRNKRFCEYVGSLAKKIKA